MSKIVKCKACNENVSKGARACPNCGKDQRNFIRRHKILSCGIGFLVLCGLVAGSYDDSVESNPDSGTTQENTINTSKKEKYVVDIQEVDNSNPYMTTLKIIIENNNRDVNYLQVMVPVFDADGVKIGDGVANTGALKKGQKVKLEVIFFEALPEDVTFGEIDITAF